MRRLIVAAHCLGVSGCGAAGGVGAPSAVQSHRLAAVLRDSTASRILAGAARPQTADGEFGVITGARLSPNGRWVAVRDAVAPHIKMVDSTGVVRWTLSFPDDTAPDYLSPVIALSNKALLVFRIGTKVGELYDFRGTLSRTVDGVSFTPLAATAVSDSVWLVYGPTKSGTEGGSQWVHCLFMGAGAKLEWRSAFTASAHDADGLGPANAPVITVNGTEALLEHRSNEPSILSVRCGSRSSSPVVEVVARGVLSDIKQDGPSNLPTYSFRPGSSGFAVLGLQDYRIAVGIMSVDNSLVSLSESWLTPSQWLHPWQASRKYARADVRTDFELIGRGQTDGVVSANVEYSAVDSRAGIGALFVVHPPIFSVLRLVDLDRLTSATVER